MRVRRATADDAAAIATIYAPYVEASVVSFETEAPDAAEIAHRMAALGDLYPWLAACDEDGAMLETPNNTVPFSVTLQNCNPQPLTP